MHILDTTHQDVKTMTHSISSSMNSSYVLFMVSIVHGVDRVFIWLGMVACSPTIFTHFDLQKIVHKNNLKKF